MLVVSIWCFIVGIVSLCCSVQAEIDGGAVAPLLADLAGTGGSASAALKAAMSINQAPATCDASNANVYLAPADSGQTDFLGALTYCEKTLSASLGKTCHLPQLLTPSQTSQFAALKVAQQTVVWMGAIYTGGSWQWYRYGGSSGLGWGSPNYLPWHSGYPIMTPGTGSYYVSYARIYPGSQSANFLANNADPAFVYDTNNYGPMAVVCTCC